MIYQETIARQVAQFLLEIKAVILRPDQPFRWASGWNSPIYCDNRLILSYPQVRSQIRDFWVEAVKDFFPQVNAIAGVATAGIAHAALIADSMELPMAYVRSKPKEHGTGKMIEGRLEADWKVLVVEDLISTGKSSLQAADSIKAEGISVSGLMAIFSYAFPEAEKAFAERDIPYYTLCSYPILVEEAVKMGYIREETLPLLNSWRQDPATWGK